MSSLLKSKSGHYYVQFYRDDRTPQRRQVPLKTTSKRVASRVRSHVDELYLRGEFDPWETTDFVAATTAEDRTRLYSDAVDLFLVSREGRSSRTIESYRNPLRSLGRSLRSGVRVHEIGREDVLSWLRSGRGNVTTQHSMARHLSVFFRWAAGEGEITDRSGQPVANPTLNLRLPPMPRKSPKWIRPSEVQLILNALPTSGQGTTMGTHWLYPLVRSNVILGLRASEVCRLRWNEVDLSRGQLSVYTTKGHSERIVPLSSVVVTELERLWAWSVEVCGAEPEGEDRVFRTAPTAGMLCPRYLSRQFKRRVVEALPNH